MSEVFPPPFDVLANAGGVTLGPVGYAAVMTPEFKAYQQASAVAAQHPDVLQRMLATATPAGRMYAAMLSGTLGDEASKRAWASLESQMDVVSFAGGGCMMMRAPLGHFAVSVRVSGSPIGALPPWQDPNVPEFPRYQPQEVQRPSRGRERSAIERGIEWVRTHPGTIAAVFWAIAGSAYGYWWLMK